MNLFSNDNLENRNYLTESEGGSPNKSKVGQILITHTPSILAKQSYAKVSREPSGVHPSSPMFAGIEGTYPHGVRVTYPVIPPFYYNGILPLALQPKLKKPLPYE